MKKIIMLLLAMVLMVPGVQAENKKLQKALDKEYKAKLKEYKKDKWKIFGSSRTLEVALLQHYDKLKEGGENAREIVGVASRFKSKNAGYQQAVNNACMTYAQQAGSSLKGRVIGDIAADGVDTSSEFDHFYAAYERQVEKEIKGEMTESYSVIRCVNPKTEEYEMMTFFVVNENAAAKARIRAAENAMLQSEIAKSHAQKVSDFVKEGFNR